MAAPAARSVWLFGPATDLMLGCGGAYALAFAALALAGPGLRGAIPFELAPLVLLLSGTPHYGATLLRAYQRSEDRRAYAFFTVWVTLALAALFVLAFPVPVIGSLLLTLMLSWSPWHYSGQNYGILLMFLGRAGVRLPSALKRAIYASFLLSFALTLLAVHGETPSGQYAPTGFGGTVYRFLPLGIPEAWRRGLLAVCGAGYGLATAAAGWGLLRRARPHQLAPAAALFATQALWFVVPTLARQLALAQGVEPLGLEHAAYAFLWVAVGHSVQYLWITSWYARRDRGAGGPRYLLRCLLAGAALWTLPALLFAPGVLASVPYDLGLYALVSAVVNLHHFALDGALWKLRDGRVARVLLRSREPPDPAAAGVEAPSGRLAPALLALGAVCAAVTAAAALEGHAFVRAVERGDVARAERALGRLAWMGRDSPALRDALAHAQLLAGDSEAATAQLDAALAIRPTAQSWSARAWLAMRSGRVAEAIAAYERARELDPTWLAAANNLAWLRATSDDPALRDPRGALEIAEAIARASGNRDARALDTLAVAYAAAGHLDAARRTASRALRRARAEGEAELAARLEERLALYRRGRPYRESAEAVAARVAGGQPPPLVQRRELY